MWHQTESGQPGSGRPGASTRGPALAILAAAPRPGRVLQDLCPPLTAAEAGALQTAWLKQIAQELPGVQVCLFGWPSDAMPMLRYFAGPGVELREWQHAAAPNGSVEAMVAAAGELFDDGYGPVLVRWANAPDPDQASLLACVEACCRGELVWAPEQRGAPWLLGLASRAQQEGFDRLARHLGAHRAGLDLYAQLCDEGVPIRRGPWARAVQDAFDLDLLLGERGRPAGHVPTLPVRNLQAALQFYGTVLGATLRGAEVEGATEVRATVVRATVVTPQFELRLQACSQDFVRNGLCWPNQAVEALHELLQAKGCVAKGDQLAPRIGGGRDFVATDQDGNRLTFRAVRLAR